MTPEEQDELDGNDARLLGILCAPKAVTGPFYFIHDYLIFQCLMVVVPVQKIPVDTAKLTD